MSAYFLVPAMIFAHILDDFVLQQGILANMKQKKFWQEHAPDKMYRHDYIVALMMHSLSWSFLILLPIALSCSFAMSALYLGAFLVNAVVHGITDHIKANLRKINLIADQSIHLLQILITFFIFRIFG